MNRVVVGVGVGVGVEGSCCTKFEVMKGGKVLM
jgi:hypothetical protein